MKKSLNYLVGRLAHDLDEMRTLDTAASRELFADDARGALDSLRELSEDMPGRAYFREKLAALEQSMIALGEERIADGHPREQHIAWCLDAIILLRVLVA